MASSDDAIKKVLDEVRARADLRARRANDPVDFVHRFKRIADRELVALAAANLAFGNVKAIRMKVAELLRRIGPSPADATDDEAGLFAALDGWKHRVFIGEDVARLLIGARKLQHDHGSLGAAFAKDLKAADDQQSRETRQSAGAHARVDASLTRGHAVGRGLGQSPNERDALQEALSVFCDRIRVAGGLPLPGQTKKSDRRGPINLLSNARAGGGAKRLLLFLRWMVRPADGIDLGLWSKVVSPKRLLMPVDVHIHKLSRNLGFTTRTDVSWKTAVEITNALARFDEDDPTRYDFSLCHMGMLQRCPSRADPVRCEGCGVKPVCIHHASAPQTKAKRAKAFERP